jgi:hypothetical protein
MGTRRKLGSKSVTVLDLTARGRSYEQILTLHPDLTYLDIFGAAREALGLDEQTSTTYEQRLAQIREAYPRAYEKWTDREDVDDIAAQLQRQPSAIRSRIAKRNPTAGNVPS